MRAYNVKKHAYNNLTSKHNTSNLINKKPKHNNDNKIIKVTTGVGIPTSKNRVGLEPEGRGSDKISQF